MLSPLKYFYSFINLILFGNIYVSIGAVCLIQSTRIQLQHTEQFFEYSFLVFFATLFIYNFQRFFYKPQLISSLNSIRRKWIFENQTLVKLLAIIGFVGVCVGYYYNDSKVLYYLLPLLVLSLLYFLSFLRLRQSPLFKLFTLVIVWTMVTSVVPVLLNGGDLFTSANLVHIGLRFCFMMAICIPFDIRDLDIDIVDKVSTLPHVIGENSAKWLAFSFMLLHMLLVFPEYALGVISLKIMIALLIAAVINSALVLMSTSRKGEYFYVAGVDGTMILQGVFLRVAEMYF